MCDLQCFPWTVVGVDCTGTLVDIFWTSSGMGLYCFLDHISTGDAGARLYVHVKYFLVVLIPILAGAVCL